MSNFVVNGIGLGSGIIAVQEDPFRALEVVILYGLDGNDIMQIIGAIGVVIVSFKILYDIFR